MWVFDATPLIYLAKIDRLDLVDHLDDSCVIPEAVYTEVVTTGIDHGYPDARRIEQSIEDGKFEIVAVKQSDLHARLEHNDNLSEADVAVLACADGHDGVAVIDETYGRNVADVEGVTTRGTAYLVLKLAKEGQIKVNEARSAIDSMVEAGWYCSPADYSRIVQTLGE